MAEQQKREKGGFGTDVEEFGGKAKGAINEFGFGEGAAERQERLLNNEFRQVGAPGSFISGNIAGTQGQLGGLQRQIGNRGGFEFAGNQRNFIQGLEADARGGGAGQQLARQNAAEFANRGIQQQLAMQAGQRGAGATLGARGAASNSANISGQAAQAATMGGLQAQLAARQQLGGALQGAGQTQLGFTGLQQQGQLEALRQQGLLAQLEQQGMQEREKARTQRFGALAGSTNQNLPNQAQAGSAFIGGAIGGIFG